MRSLCSGALKYLYAGVLCRLAVSRCLLLPSALGRQRRGEAELWSGREEKGTDMKAGEDGIFAQSVLDFPSLGLFCPGRSTYQYGPACLY